MDDEDKKMASTIYKVCGWIKDKIPNLTIDEYWLIDKIESGCCEILFERQEGE